MEAQPAAGIRMGDSLDLGDRLLQAPPSRSHLVQVPPPLDLQAQLVALRAEVQAQADTIQRLEAGLQWLGLRLALLEAPPWWRRAWRRLQGWWTRYGRRA